MTAHPVVRTGTALLGIAGALLLAGCSGEADADQAGSGSSDAGSSGSSGQSAAGPYADGTYTAEGAYNTPETVEKVEVTLTLADGAVTDVTVSGDPQAPESKRFQGQFIDGISDVVVGKKLEELQVDRVAGSSLTSGGFNQAVDAIKEEAAAAAE